MSDERASGWTDTLESKRESKLRWKQEVLDREEEKRQEIDKKEAEIRNKLRQQTIQKAKALQYEENERVRLLRSQQLYTDVIETRQQQLKEKKQLGDKLKEEERHWHQRTITSFQVATENHKREQNALKERAIKNARAMVAQHIETERNSRMLQEKRMKEGKEIIRKVELDNKNSRKEKTRKKAQARQKAKEEMKKLALDVKKKEEEQNSLERADEEKRQRDIERSSFIAKGRKDLEVKHFEERQAARNLLSDQASKELEIRASKEVEIFIRDQKAQESKERARKEEEARKALELEKTVHESRKEQILLKEEKRRKEKEQNTAFVTQSTKQCLNELAREKKKEAETRNRNLKYRKLQEEQTSAAQQKQVAQRKDKLEEERKVRLLLYVIFCQLSVFWSLTMI